MTKPNVFFRVLLSTVEIAKAGYFTYTFLYSFHICGVKQALRRHHRSRRCIFRTYMCLCVLLCSQTFIVFIKMFRFVLDIATVLCDPDITFGSLISRQSNFLSCTNVKLRSVQSWCCRTPKSSDWKNSSEKGTNAGDGRPIFFLRLQDM